MARFTMIFPPDPGSSFSLAEHWRMFSAMDVVIVAAWHLLRRAVAEGNIGNMPRHATVRAAIAGVVCQDYLALSREVPEEYGGKAPDKIRKKITQARMVLFHVRETILEIASGEVGGIFKADLTDFADMLESDMPASWYRP